MKISLFALTLISSINVSAAPLASPVGKFEKVKTVVIASATNKSACEMRWNGVWMIDSREGAVVEGHCEAQVAESVAFTFDGKKYEMELNSGDSASNSCEFSGTTQYQSEKREMVYESADTDGNVCQIKIKFSKEMNSVSVSSNKNCADQCGISKSISIKKATRVIE